MPSGGGVDPQNEPFSISEKARLPVSFLAATNRKEEMGLWISPDAVAETTLGRNLFGFPGHSSL
jgi:hypothetical protein